MRANQSILLITTDPLPDIKKYLDIDGAHPNIDTLVITPEPTIGIETIRNIKPFTSRRPLKGSTKHIIFVDAHLLTIESQNALLKLLEEPPSYLTIILTAPYTHSFLDTVLSRCQLIRADHPTTEPDATPPQLAMLLTLAPPARLKLIPLDTKVRATAVSYCQHCIREAEAMLRQNPTHAHAQNLEILNESLNGLTANANPTLAITDAIMRLACS